jgi:general stress protein 26
MDKNKVLEFIKKQSLAVYSTASLSGQPQSAVMAITVTDDWSIYMSTEPTTRKIRNLAVNPASSLVIGGLNNDPSVQLDGRSIIIPDSEVESAKSLVLSIHPELKDYLNPSSKFIKFTPSWLRYSDFSQNPPEIVGFSDF